MDAGINIFDNGLRVFKALDSLDDATNTTTIIKVEQPGYHSSSLVHHYFTGYVSATLDLLT